MITKNASNILHKIAYGGDLTGDGTSYYDYANFFSVDDEWDEPDWHEDRERYKDTIKSMKQLAKNIRNMNKVFDIDGVPVTKMILSKKPYNEANNIDALDWADQVDAALKSKNIEDIDRLARYGYAWYGTDKAQDMPDVDDTTDIRMPWIIPALIGLGTVGAGAAGVYGLHKALQRRVTV